MSVEVEVGEVGEVVELMGLVALVAFAAFVELAELAEGLVMEDDLMSFPCANSPKRSFPEAAKVYSPTP